MAGHDAFYALPDSVISSILSKIPIKDAVRSSLLSKRWRYLYTQMPKLTLSPDLVLGPDCPFLDPLLVSRAENIISNILHLHSHNLEAFHLHYTGFDHNQQRFTRESVCKWVRYASSYNVQHLTLSDHYVPYPFNGRLSALRETPPPAFFSCSHLVTLYLRDYVLTSIPLDFVGFPHLISCKFEDVQLTDESLISFISLCPLLQKLELNRHGGLGNIVIASPTIEYLFLHDVKSLSIKCPKLKLLHGSTFEDLSVNGVRFHELSIAVFYVEMDSGIALREFSMEFSTGESPGTKRRFLDIVGNIRCLKGLVIYLGVPFEREAEMDVPLLNLLHLLPNLQLLHLMANFVQELAKEPIPDCLASPHVNLKKIRVQVLEFDYKEIAIISCLLQSTPCLERMEIQLPEEYEEGPCMYFLKDILYLRRASLLARIIIMHDMYEI